MELFAFRGLLLSVTTIFVVIIFICYSQLRDDSISRFERITTSDASSHELCILIPFRNCEYELELMAPALHLFLNNQSVKHKFLVLNQTDSLRFNRAALINVGWFEADRLGCDYLVMHDVDLVPLNPALSYRFPGKGTIRHISAGKYHPIKRYDYKSFIGGILMLTMEDYKRMNGMSNKYWGWGLEDDEFYLRIRKAKLSNHIERPSNLTTNRTNTFRHIHGPERKRDYAMLYNQKEMSKKFDRFSGLSTVQYTIKARERLQFANATIVLAIQIELECDRAWTPYCEFASDV